MEHIDLLLTIAEIGVAVAGFAALATVIGQSRRHTDPQVNAIRLRGLMNVPLATMFLALIPAALLRAPSLEPWACHLSSVAGLLISAIFGWGALKRDRPRRHLPGYNRPVAAANYTILANRVHRIRRQHRGRDRLTQRLRLPVNAHSHAGWRFHAVRSGDHLAAQR